jgi:hypothetical protein
VLRAPQVEEVSSMLNSGDAFILLTPGKMWVWCVPTKTSPVEIHSNDQDWE